MKKASYVQPALVKHESLRDITAGKSGYCNDRDREYGFGHGWGGFGRWGR